MGSMNESSRECTTAMDEPQDNRLQPPKAFKRISFIPRDSIVQRLSEQSHRRFG